MRTRINIATRIEWGKALHAIVQLSAMMIANGSVDEFSRWHVKVLRAVATDIEHALEDAEDE